MGWVQWGGWVTFFGSIDSRINLHTRAKFGCSQTVVSKKGGGGLQTDTHKGTLQIYFIVDEVLNILIYIMINKSD